MAYDKKLADRIREEIADLPHVEEKEMMGGLVFMVNDKMCVGVVKDEMMCRIHPGFHESAVEKTGCRTMDFTKRPMIGYVMIDETGLKTPADLAYWIGLALEFNEMAKSYKKR